MPIKSDCSGHPDNYLDGAQFQICHMFSMTIHYSVATQSILPDYLSGPQSAYRAGKWIWMWGGIPYAFQQCPKGTIVLTLVHWCHKQFITVLRYRPGSYLYRHPALSQLPLMLGFRKAVNGFTWLKMDLITSVSFKYCWWPLLSL